MRHYLIIILLLTAGCLTATAGDIYVSATAGCDSAAGTAGWVLLGVAMAALYIFFN